MLKFWDKQALNAYTSRSVGASRGSRDITGNGQRTTSNDPLKPPLPENSIKPDTPWISEAQRATTDNSSSTTGMLKFAHSKQILTTLTTTNGVLKSITPPPAVAIEVNELSNASTASPTESRKLRTDSPSKKSMRLLEPLDTTKELSDEEKTDDRDYAKSFTVIENLHDSGGEEINDKDKKSNACVIITQFDNDDSDSETDILDRSDIVSDGLSEIV